MNSTADPRRNLFLAALPSAELERLLPQMELIEMMQGAVLFEPGEIMSHVFFPVTSIVSLVYTLKDGATVKVAAVGYEGLIGITQFLGGQTAPCRAVVQSAGQGFRLKWSVLAQGLGEPLPLARLLLRYTQALMTQSAQIAVCNRHHSIEQQLCRWLLLSLDRLHSNEVAVTQELIAGALGVRRQGVAAAAHALLGAGVIRYRRGCITVLDRNQLEQRCCECYAVVKREYERLLPAPRVV